MHLIYPATPDTVANREAEFRKIIIDTRAYLDPGVMAYLPNVIKQNTAAWDAEFQREYPNIARVLIFRETVSPNDRTAKREFDPANGPVLRLAVGKGTTVKVPMPNADDTAVAFVYPYYPEDDGWGRLVLSLSDEPLIFVGALRGKAQALAAIRADISSYYAALASQQVTTPAVPLEQYAKLQAGFLALQAAQTTATELGEEYERLRLELVASNQRRVKLEAALDLMRKSFASISQLLD